jgi:DeoR family transcriptional regulator, repressor of opine catabolism and conjugal transfer
MSLSENKYAPERQARILEILARLQRVEVTALAGELVVSAATIRRDLSGLELAGRVRRTHGGAVPLHMREADPPLESRAYRQVGEKDHIGRAAAALVQPGETVFVDAGTTAAAVSRHLAQVRPLRIVTNAVNLFEILSATEDREIHALGGQLRRENMSTVGPLAADAARRFAYTTAFLGVNAIDLDRGLITTPTQAEAAVQRVVIEMTQRVIVVADHTKFTAAAAAVIAPLKSVLMIVTDGATASDVERRVAKFGPRVVRALHST